MNLALPHAQASALSTDAGRQLGRVSARAHGDQKMNYARLFGGERSAAQDRVTGGRWRRIVMLGDVLAEHVLELRGRARTCLAVEVAGGSFVCLAAAAPPWVCHRGRTNIALAGSHCRDPRRPYPRLGSKPVPAPRTRYEVRASLRRVFTAATATSTPGRGLRLQKSRGRRGNGRNKRGRLGREHS